MSIEKNIVTMMVGASILVNDKSRWTQLTLATTDQGMMVSYTDPRACKFCLRGALLVAGYRAGLTPAARRSALARIDDDFRQVNEDGLGLSGYNDCHSHEEVRGAFGTLLIFYNDTLPSAGEKTAELLKDM